MARTIAHEKGDGISSRAEGFMKKVFLCAAMMAVGMATAEAERTVEDVASQLGRLMDETWAMQGGQQVWSHPPRGQLTTCTVLIAQLDKLGAPKTTPIKLATKTPQWEPGEIPLEAAREVCDDWVVYGAVGDWWMSLQMAIYEAEKIGTSAYYDTAIFNLCLMQYAKLLEKGVKPSSPFPERKVTLSSGTEVVITGTVEEVRTIVEAVAPKPVNLLVNAPFTTVAEAADLGVRRISVGGTLARAAWGGWLAAAREIADDGTFTAFTDLPNVDAAIGGGA